MHAGAEMVTHKVWMKGETVQLINFY